MVSLHRAESKWRMGEMGRFRDEFGFWNAVFGLKMRVVDRIEQNRALLRVLGMSFFVLRT